MVAEGSCLGSFHGCLAIHTGATTHITELSHRQLTVLIVVTLQSHAAKLHGAYDQRSPSLVLRET